MTLEKETTWQRRPHFEGPLNSRLTQVSLYIQTGGVRHSVKTGTGLHFMHPIQNLSDDVMHPIQNLSDDAMHPIQSLSDDVMHPIQSLSDDVMHPIQSMCDVVIR